MFLDLKEIGPETLTFDGRVNVPETEWYRGESIRFRTVSVAVQIERSEESRTLSGQMSAEVELNCCRCLEPWSLDLDVPLGLRLVAGVSPESDPEGKGSDDGNGQEEENEWRLDGYVLDLVRLCREFVLLHLPMKPVCRPDCKGLCPKCGSNRNVEDCRCGPAAVDPRLAPLLEWKKRIDVD